MAAEEAECLIEIITVGNTTKVSAIDPATGIEVSVAGPAEGCEEALTRLAARKLARRLHAVAAGTPYTQPA